jgi:hypothetical protein
MVSKQRATDGTNKTRKGRRTEAATPTSDTTRPAGQGSRLIDVDPWAMLLEQLMEMPEEKPAERKDGKTG